MSDSSTPALSTASCSVVVTRSSELEPPPPPPPLRAKSPPPRSPTASSPCERMTLPAAAAAGEAPRPALVARAASHPATLAGSRWTGGGAASSASIAAATAKHVPAVPHNESHAVSSSACVGVAADDRGDDGPRAGTTTTTTTPPGEFPPPPPGALRLPAAQERQSRKRDVPDAPSGPTSEPASKRPRFRAPKTKHALDGVPFGPGAFHQPALQPPSPLFFSNSRRPRPPLPARFSSSEAAARMLHKARTEDSHVKTVTLARGTVATPASAAGSSPGSSTPTSAPRPDLAARRSLERSLTGLSSGSDVGSTSSDSGPVGRMLSSVGVMELLEQDERPTFIVDLVDSRNYGIGALQLAFANASLKSIPSLEQTVSGTMPNAPDRGAKTFLQFKSWLLSAAVNGESLHVCLPSFEYAGLTWNCSTLRKRFRIMGGAVMSPLSTSHTSSSASAPPAASAATDGLPVSISAGDVAEEPADYFAGAVPAVPTPVLSDRVADTSTEASPTLDVTPADDHITLSPSHHNLYGGIDLLPSAHSYVPPFQDSIALDGSLAIPSPSSSTIDALGAQVPIMPAYTPFYDWTRLPVSETMPRHIKFARGVDWASTSLGPIETWSADLRQMCNLIMASPHPAAMYWGDDLVAIYNEAYILIAGQKHPKFMGQPYRDAWPEIWDNVKEVFTSAKSTGQATMKDDDCLFIQRSDFLEETYFSWSIIPLVGRDGSVMGLYNPSFEKTRRKIAERRMLTLREIGERTASARDVKGFWTKVLESFEYNEYDSPFLLLYSIIDEVESDTSSIHSSTVFPVRQCVLEGALGVPEGHVAAPAQFDLREGMDGFAPVFRGVMNTDKPVLLELGSKDFPESLLRGLEWRGFGDPVRAVVVCPIHPTTGDSVLGFVVLGINPRRPYDDDYGLFVQLLSRQLATSLASVVLFEEEIRRGHKAAKLAALDRIALSKELAQRTQEAIESETRFTRMAELAPVGMFIADSSGRITYANDTWYDISRVPKTGSITNTANVWMESVADQDRVLVKQLWTDLVENAKSISSEIRFKAQWEEQGAGGRSDTWVLFSAYPEKYEDGKLKSVFGSITNISQQKWAEGIQTRKMEEAVELKRQQENFIDITSHEMRNPLSAILQCSDEITNALTNFRQSDERIMPDHLLMNCLDAAQIINLCSQHQKRIVDDILTLSKLDSQLLLVTPVDTQPLTVVQRALKMHEGELQAADIQMEFMVDQSYHDLALDWVRFDPSRVLQVLINLTTNAIKFTGTESQRTISVTMAASRQRPSEMANPPVRYFAARNKRHAMSERDWGDGEIIFIHFSVKDTGRGLSQTEKKMLFQRFSQASPRTHVQYGGSGLGLFISRELTELQGGEIGVESEAGKGSIFAFYVSARRSTAPPEDAGAPKKEVAKGLPPLGKDANESFDESTSGQAVPHSTSQQPAIQHKVLIVEDNLVNQRVLQRQLKNMGTEVHLANHGGEALEMLKKSTYWAGEATRGKLELGVVLMDQEMPVMDGLTCTKRIRQLEQEGKLTGHVPIIAVTANARPEQVQTALTTGMDDVVSKPFRIPELVPKIAQLMLRYPMPSPSQ